MRKKIGEFDSVLKKIYGSLRKRYGLSFEETLDELEEVFADEEFKTLPVFLISNVDIYSRELIEEINALGKAQAYGFYRDGDFPYKIITEVKEALPQLIRQSDDDKFFYVSVYADSKFMVERSGVVCLRIEKHNGDLWLNIVKNRKTVQNEIIREYRAVEDKEKFLPVVNKFFHDRWEKRPDVFVKSYNPNWSVDNNVVICFKSGEVAGFIIYGYGSDISSISMKDAMTFTIWDIYVKEEYRRQGVATRMYEKVVRIAEKCKSPRVRFKVFADDAETNLFLKSLHSKELYSLYEMDLK